MAGIHLRAVVVAGATRMLVRLHTGGVAKEKIVPTGRRVCGVGAVGVRDHTRHDEEHGYEDASLHC